MNLQAIQKFIIAHEGWKKLVYFDSATPPNPTVGVGVNLNAGHARAQVQRLGVDFDALYHGKVSLTDAQIQTLLDEDIQSAIDDAKTAAPNFDALPDEVQMVLVDLSFNMGLPTLLKFKRFLAAIASERFVEAESALHLSKWYIETGVRAKECCALIKQAGTLAST